MMKKYTTLDDRINEFKTKPATQIFKNSEAKMIIEAKLKMIECSCYLERGLNNKLRYEIGFDEILEETE